MGTHAAIGRWHENRWFSKIMKNRLKSLHGHECSCRPLLKRALSFRHYMSAHAHDYKCIIKKKKEPRINNDMHLHGHSCSVVVKTSCCSFLWGILIVVFNVASEARECRYSTTPAALFWSHFSLGNNDGRDF